MQEGYFLYVCIYLSVYLSVTTLLTLAVTLLFLHSKEGTWNFLLVFHTWISGGKFPFKSDKKASIQIREYLLGACPVFPNSEHYGSAGVYLKDTHCVSDF